MRHATSLFFSLALLVFTPMAIAGGGSSSAASANADRLIMVTYWGDDRIALIDTQGEEGKEEVWSIDALTAGCAKPYDVRVDAAGARAYATCSGTNLLAVVDIAAQQISHTIEVGSSPRDLQLYSDDSRILVANSGNDTVSVVDVENKSVLYTVAVELQPYGVAVVDGGKTALVTGWASGDLHVLDLSETSGRVRERIPVGMLPYTVVASPDGKVAHVAVNAKHAVVSVDVAKAEIVKTTPVGRNPWSLAVSKSSGNLMVTNNRSNDLTLLRTGTAPGKQVETVATYSAGTGERAGTELARAAKNVSLSSNGLIAAFTDLANNQVVVMDTSSGELRKVINVGKAPYGIEFFRPAPAKLARVAKS